MIAVSPGARGRGLAPDCTPAVTELLYPRFLWEVPEGATGPVEIVEVDESAAPWLGRRTLEAQVSVPDWDTRDAAWSDTLWVADGYRVLVDLERGVLLRVACIFRGREFVVREVTHLVLDRPIPREVFAPPGTG